MKSKLHFSLTKRDFTYGFHEIFALFLFTAPSLSLSFYDQKWRWEKDVENDG